MNNVSFLKIELQKKRLLFFDEFGTGKDLPLFIISLLILELCISVLLCFEIIFSCFSSSIISSFLSSLFISSFLFSGINSSVLITISGISLISLLIFALFFSESLMIIGGLFCSDELGILLSMTSIFEKV